MGKTLAIALLLTSTNLALSQQESKKAATDSLTASFGFEEFYSAKITTYPIGDNLQVELSKFYQRNGITERLRIPLVLKKYLTKKTYLLGGVQTEMEFLPNGTKRFRGDVLIGAGHEVNKKFSLNGILQLPVINPKEVTPLGALNPGTGFLNLGAKYKF